VFDTAKILYVCVQKVKIMVRVRYIFESFGLLALLMVWYSEQDTVFQKMDFFSILRWKMHNKARSSSEILLCNYQSSVPYTKYNFHNPESVAPKINIYLHEVLYFLNRRYKVFPFTDKMFYVTGLKFHCYCLFAVPLDT